MNARSLPRSAARIRVAVVGCNGRMGRPIVHAIEGATDLELVAKVGRGDNLKGLLASTRPEVMVDVAGPQQVAQHGRWALEAGVRPVLGSSGLVDEDLADLQRHCKRAGLSGLWVPNFSLGAVLLQRFAEAAACHFPDVEIIEAHHTAKLDAPSGTALHTADRISRQRRTPPSPTPEGASRGMLRAGVPVHSLRLPGVIADQEVRFGGLGETLSLRHVSSDRSSFMPGVLLSVRRVGSLPEFCVGLDAVLESSSL